MQAVSGIFSMRSLWDALPFSGHSTPDVKVRECRLGALICNRDAKSATESKVDSWKRKLDAADFCPNKAHPDCYLLDIGRMSFELNGQIFRYVSGQDKDGVRKRWIDNVILGMVNNLKISLSGSTEGAHLMRYFLQELMSQAIFDLDPDFRYKYNSAAYDGKGLMLADRDEPSCHKQPHISLSALNSTTLVLQAVQYWKVVKFQEPLDPIGYDAQRVELTIDFTKATRETLLSCFELARCVISFHGFRKSIDEISY